MLLLAEMEKDINGKKELKNTKKRASVRDAVMIFLKNVIEKMVMNKEQLKERINELPKFEKREVKVKTGIGEESDEWAKQIHSAICEVGKTISYAYVSLGYKLVQFKDVFLPILDSIEEEVKGYCVHYGGYAMMKLFPEKEELKEGDARFGICAINSVDLSSSVMVKFIIMHNDRYFTVPPKIAGLKKQHTGNVKDIAKDYIGMVGKVKDLWKQISIKFPKYQIVEKITDDMGEGLYIEFGTAVERLKLGKRLAKKVRKNFEQHTFAGGKYTLWDFMTMVLEEISNATHKSECHKEKHIDKICQACFEFNFMLGI